ncbi:hypothetical protein MKX08_000215 [Trichoderma sp. CBMAI-0020]|nr:hypothetical protein MKX08_000215 [Trichoderma sp. CBMAI-0020]
MSRPNSYGRNNKPTGPLITFNKKYSDFRVLPPVAPTITPMVAPMVPVDNNKLELKKVLKIN